MLVSEPALLLGRFRSAPGFASLALPADRAPVPAASAEGAFAGSTSRSRSLDVKLRSRLFGVVLRSRALDVVFLSRELRVVLPSLLLLV